MVMAVRDGTLIRLTGNGKVMQMVEVVVAMEVVVIEVVVIVVAVCEHSKHCESECNLQLDSYPLHCPKFQFESVEITSL